MELDHARYLLNFDHIELGLSVAGEWTVYYRYPCRFLDRDDFTCTVHATSDQPDICVNYNPYSCWYRRTLTQPVVDDFIRVDRTRFELLLGLLSFDGESVIIGVPDWQDLLDAITALPLRPEAPLPEAPDVDAAARAWRDDVVAGVPMAPDPGRSLAELGDPCRGCAAHCCTSLLFPYNVPATRSALDHLRFCLGFPGWRSVSPTTPGPSSCGPGAGTWRVAVAGCTERLIALSSARITTRPAARTSRISDWPGRRVSSGCGWRSTTD